ARLRRGEVIKEAGYDGEYGVIRLMRPEELTPSAALFDLPAASPLDPAAAVPEPAGTPAADAARPSTSSGPRPAAGAIAGPERDREAAGPGTAGSLLDGLDPDQRAAAEAAGPLMIIAGPGTGKTRTLTYRIAAQVAE